MKAKEEVVTEPIKLSPKDIQRLNAWAPYLSYKETWLWEKMIYCPKRIIAMFSGNRAGKTSTIARQYVLRIAGEHPIADKNFDFMVCNPQDIWKGHRYSLRYKERLKGVCLKCGKPLTLYFSPNRVVRCASENLPGQSD